MKIERRESSNLKVISITFDEELNRTVTVEQQKDFISGGWEEAEINWPAIGVTSAGETETFIEALQAAVKEADRLNGIPTPAR